jgi:hypothetical protein
MNWFIEANKEIFGSITFLVFLLMVGCLITIWLMINYSYWYILIALIFGYFILLLQQYLYREVKNER